MPDEKKVGPPKFNYSELRFGSLNPVVDLVYGAVIAYPIFLLGEAFTGFFSASGEPRVQWVNVMLVAFVLLYSLSDAIETRIMTERFPYRGRGRFSVDIAVALAFFTAFSGAAKASPNFLVPFSVIFFLGSIWGVYLHHDTKHECSWQYPKGVVLSHVGAGALWFGQWLSFHNAGATQIYWQDACWLLGYYMAWLAVSAAAKEWYGVPPVEADLFPTSLIDVGVRKAIRFFREG